MTISSRLSALGLALAVIAPAGMHAQADTAVKVTWGGYVDGYYAWDFGQPATLDRSFASGVPFMTQPARHNEFNVNLAFVEAKLDGARVHGRFALQTGTSVQSNYAGEAAVGFVSGPSLARLIQEAVAGVKVSDNLWIDGGIFFSHMGMESFISRDNLMYTRSLVADYSPYYQSGVKATWTRGAVTAQVDLVNGWQNISENNTGKGIGGRIDYAPNANMTLSYYNLFSDEAGNLLRTFNGVGGKFVTGSVTWLAQADFGTQDGSAGASSASWYGFMATARKQVNDTWAVMGRVERYDDKNSTIIGTGVPSSPFRANGFSFGVDMAPAPRVLWRTELRAFANETAIFPDGTSPAKKSSLFAVSSLAVTF